jgi:hypothetical protein
MEIKGKFTCEKVEPQGEGDDKYAEQVSLRAVYAGEKNEEDNTFAAATPAANVEMTISNKAAWGAFEQGKQYYGVFTPAE